MKSIFYCWTICCIAILIADSESRDSAAFRPSSVLSARRPLARLNEAGAGQLVLQPVLKRLFQQLDQDGNYELEIGEFERLFQDGQLLKTVDQLSELRRREPLPPRIALFRSEFRKRRPTEPRERQDRVSKRRMFSRLFNSNGQEARPSIKLKATVIKSSTRARENSTTTESTTVKVSTSNRMMVANSSTLGPPLNESSGSEFMSPPRLDSLYSVSNESQTVVANHQELREEISTATNSSARPASRNSSFSVFFLICLFVLLTVAFSSN